MPNLTVYVDSLFLVPFSNWSTVRSKGSKIKLSLILTKMEFLGFFDMLNLIMYLNFLLWAKFSSWSKSGSKIIILSIVQQQEIFNCTVFCNSKKSSIAQYCAKARNFISHSIAQQQEIFNCTVLCNSKKSSIAQYCAIARNI